MNLRDLHYLVSLAEHRHLLGSGVWQEAFGFTPT